MPLQAEFERRFDRQWPVQAWSQVNVVAAVSGGADSVAMLRAMHSLRQAAAREAAGEVIVAHVNHSLRADAGDDAAFVEPLAASLGCRYELRTVDTHSAATGQGDGVEAAARQLRYEALREIVHQTGARYLATAHTADDLAETVLHRIVRGTGLAGLAGIPQARRLSDSATVIRPLLAFRRGEIEAYLAQIGQDFRTDATNADTGLTRNRIRHELLPRLRDSFNPNVDGALIRLSEHAAEMESASRQVVNQLASAAVVESRQDRIVIDCSRLGSEPSYFISQLIVSQWTQWDWPRQGMTREHWQRLTEIIGSAADVPPINFPGGVSAQKNRAGQLVLTRPVED